MRLQEALKNGWMEVLRGLKELAHVERALLEEGDFDTFGRLLRRQVREAVDCLQQIEQGAVM